MPFEGLFRRWRRAPPPVPPPVAPAPAAAATPPAAASLSVPPGARRPLVATTGGVGGFEFRIGAQTQQRVLRRGDTVAAAAHTNAVLAAMRITAQAGRVALAELPAVWLDRPGLDLVPGQWLALTYDAPAAVLIRRAPDAPAALADWRAAGARVGWERLGGPSALPDFYLLRPDESDLAPLLARVAACRARAPLAQLVVTDLADVDALETLLGAGVHYACLAEAPRAGDRAAAPLPPQVQRLCGLLNRLVQDSDTAPVAAEIKGDVALAVGLLRMLRAARFGAGREITSVEQAVLLLGRDELYRWLSMLLVRCCGERPVAAALQEMALARARLLELLAAERGQEAPGALFALGLFSMLPVLLRTPAEVALRAVTLPEAAQEALFEQRGPWAPYLALALAVDARGGDLDDAEAAAFSGTARVLELHSEAWAWAAQQATAA